jgi:hypothetical protein
VKHALSSLPGVTNIETDAISTTALVSVVPGKFDAVAAVAALEKAHYPATKAEDVSPTANPAEESPSDAKPEETIEAPAEGEPVEGDTTEKPAEPAEATTEAAPKEETEVVE